MGVIRIIARLVNDGKPARHDRLVGVLDKAAVPYLDSEMLQPGTAVGVRSAVLAFDGVEQDLRAGAAPFQTCRLSPAYPSS